MQHKNEAEQNRLLLLKTYDEEVDTAIKNVSLLRNSGEMSQREFDLNYRCLTARKR